MDRAREIAAEILRDMGFGVEIIPESTRHREQRADLFVTDGTLKLIVEVKQKFDDHRHMEAGESVLRVTPHSRSNPIDAVFRRATKQTVGTPQDPNTFSILWLHAEGIDADLKSRRAMNTFYGLVPLMHPSQGNTLVPCFYFDFNTAFRIQSVHGLAILNHQGLQLCLNEFADGADSFRASPFVHAFRDGLVDPAECEASGTAIALRSDISRKYESDVLRELRRLTGKDYSPIRMERHSASVFIPDPEPQ